MGLLADLTPLNALAEKEKFLRDSERNPVFTYKRSFKDDELYGWGRPKAKVADYCLNQLRAENLRESGEMIDQAFILQAISEFNQTYQLKNPIKIEFSEHFATKVRVSSDTIYFKLPIRYNSQTFRGLYRHELETHILRRLNHLQNFSDQDIVPELALRRTEEGLANLHSHLFRENKVISKTFLSYYSTYLSQQYSFAEMFAKLLELRMNQDKAWNLCLRNKRGLTDTSQPGGFTKDICYLEGTIQVWDWLMNVRHHAHSLYFGRLSLTKVDELLAEGKTYPVLTPKFLEDESHYRKMITEIGQVNDFATLKGVL